LGLYPFLEHLPGIKLLLNSYERMVVLAIAILNKLGRLLISRQFREMQRTRVEGLLAAFPKLLENEMTRSGENRQHTFLESDTVRYVYQPVENLYVVLITNKTSNIVQDLETLRLVSKLLAELSPIVGVIDETAVYEAAFDLIFAFDEVIDWGGYAEAVNVPQIRQYLEMYSHEERLAKMIKESKMHEAKEEMRRKANLIEKQKQDLAKLPPEIRRLMGLEGSSVSAGSGAPAVSTGAYSTGNMRGFGPQDFSGALGGSTLLGDVGPAPSLTLGATRIAADQSASITVSAGGRGLSLGKPKARTEDWMAHLHAESETSSTDAQRSRVTPDHTEPTASQRAAKTVPSESATRAVATSSIPASDFHLTTEEKLSISLTRDGRLESFQVHGELLLQIRDQKRAHARIRLKPLPESMMQKVQLRLHPMLDRSLWQQSWVLAQRNAERPFPYGSPTPMSLIKWRFQSTDESLLPVLLTCWPTVSSDETSMTIEYEMMSRASVSSDLCPPSSLSSVQVHVPLPRTAVQPGFFQLTRVDGRATLDEAAAAVLWTLPPLEAPCSGALEFTIAAVENPERMFPIQIQISATEVYTKLEILRVEVATSPESAPTEETAFTQEHRLLTDRFEIV